MARQAWFRLVASRQVGWGHLARCAALAAELRSRGWCCILWANAELEQTPPDLLGAFPHILPAAMDWFNHPPPDVSESDWIVVDDHGADDVDLRRLTRSLRALGSIRCARLLVIDDEARRRLEAADLILNTRLGLDRSLYAQEVPALLGSRYALLRPGLSQPERVTPSFPPDGEGVLIMLGGTDPRCLTPHVLNALADVDCERFCPVVVRSRHLPGGEALREALDRFSASVWIGGLSASLLAGWAGTCRFAISAAGGTLYEFAHLRLPFLAIIAAENQRTFAAEVRRNWGMPVVDVDSGLRGAVASALRATLAKDAGAWRATLAVAEVDGRGAARVVDAMEHQPWASAHVGRP